MPAADQYVLTLICNPRDQRLSRSLIDAATTAVQAKQVAILAPEIAADFFFTPETDASFTASLANELRRKFAGFDVFIQPVHGREKKLLIADMDATIIEQECLDELAGFAGLKPQVSAITEQAMRGELDFEAALRQRVAMLKGLPLATLEKTLFERISLTQGANTLVPTMNARGAMTALVSGGFTFFTHRIAQALGFQDNQGNVLGEDGPLLDGTVGEPVLGKQAKRDALHMQCDNLGISPGQALAVGDGANDLAMLEAAGTGVAFHAKPAVAAAAKFRIDHGDLTALLYLQGIAAKDFVTL